MKAYYDRRAPEYDEWYLGSGRFAERDRPGWDEEIEALRRTLEALPPAKTLDVACGTGFLTRHLPGESLIQPVHPVAFHALQGFPHPLRRIDVDVPRLR